MRFLIDECLNASLVQVANAAGYEAYHVNHLGKSGSEDYQLKKLILLEENTFVTNNARDFQRFMRRRTFTPALWSSCHVSHLPFRERFFGRSLISSAPNLI